MAGNRYGVDGRVVFLTGGARGIGGETARQLVQRGARVALVDRDPEELERHASELGERAAPFVCDVTDPEALERTVAAAVERFGGIDVTVANAGIAGPATTIRAIDPPDFERVLEINLLGVWRTVRATLPHVVERQGYILPVASIAAAIPTPLLTAYGASKAGVEAFGRGLRMELAPSGTRVGVAYFGVIDTRLAMGALAEPSIAELNDLMPRLVRRPAPVAKAAAAIVRGIERRSKRVYHPFWVPWLLASRGVLGSVERTLPRRRQFKTAVRVAESDLEHAVDEPQREPVGSPVS